MELIKVSSESRTSAVAGAIAGTIRDHQRAEVQCIGASAINQAVKAIILASGYLKEEGVSLECFAEFAEVQIEDKTRTAVKISVESNRSGEPF